MAARRMRILAGSASAVATVVLGLAGCAAASHPTANDVPRPASQTAAAARAGTEVRLASPLIKCADPAAPGGTLGSGNGARAATGQARQMATLGGSGSPAPLVTPRRVAVRQVGVVHLSQHGLVMLCGSGNRHCPPGFRPYYPRGRSGHRPPVLLPYRVVCIARFPLRTLPPEPQRTPMPEYTMPLHTLPPHTMPPQAAG